MLWPLRNLELERHTPPAGRGLMWLREHLPYLIRNL